MGECPGPRAPLAPNAGWEEDVTEAADALGWLDPPDCAASEPLDEGAVCAGDAAAAAGGADPSEALGVTIGFVSRTRLAAAGRTRLRFTP